jgi:hypothetical protein
VSLILLRPTLTPLETEPAHINSSGSTPVWRF